MKLNANFITDWRNIQKEILFNNFGLDVKKIKEEDISLVYFNAILRRVEQHKRKIEISDVFSCPLDNLKGWEKIQQEISNGDDLTIRLSRRINNPNLCQNSQNI